MEDSGSLSIELETVINEKSHQIQRLNSTNIELKKELDTRKENLMFLLKNKKYLFIYYAGQDYLINKRSSSALNWECDVSKTFINKYLHRLLFENSDHESIKYDKKFISTLYYNLKFVDF